MLPLTIAARRPAAGFAWRAPAAEAAETLSAPAAVASISAFFPCYNDEHSIADVVRRAAGALEEIGVEHEIVVVNDGSSDRSADVLRELELEQPRLRVVTHPGNRGYGGALLSGFAAARMEWVFYTDGDGQYDPGELRALVARAAELGGEVDVVQGFKLGRRDGAGRALVGRLYHHVVKQMFQLPIRDTDCDFRLMRRSVVAGIGLRRSSGAICVEMVRGLRDAGARFSEVGVHHFPRVHGRSQFFRVRRVVRSLADVAGLWLETRRREPRWAARGPDAGPGAA